MLLSIQRTHVNGLFVWLPCTNKLNICSFVVEFIILQYVHEFSDIDLLLSRHASTQCAGRPIQKALKTHILEF